MVYRKGLGGFKAVAVKGLMVSALTTGTGQAAKARV